MSKSFRLALAQVNVTVGDLQPPVGHGRSGDGGHDAGESA